MELTEEEDSGSCSISTGNLFLVQCSITCRVCSRAPVASHVGAIGCTSFLKKQSLVNSWSRWPRPQRIHSAGLCRIRKTWLHSSKNSANPVHKLYVVSACSLPWGSAAIKQGKALFLASFSNYICNIPLRLCITFQCQQSPKIRLVKRKIAQIICVDKKLSVGGQRLLRGFHGDWCSSPAFPLCIV